MKLYVEEKAIAAVILDSFSMPGPLLSKQLDVAIHAVTDNTIHQSTLLTITRVS